jgi:alpha-tubulin suppressor-like RCC1 family protein
MLIEKGLRAVVLLAVVASIAPAGAAGEQASEPGSPAAGQLDVGASFSCAIVTGGQVRCWGYGAEGELGVPGVTTVGAVDTPASVQPVDLGAGFTATAISSGDFHTCVIRNDGSVICWGFGADGRLGYGNTKNVGDTQTPDAAGPVDLGVGRTAKAISAGGAHTCAILDNDSVVCWGFGASGQLGYGNTNSVGDSPGNAPGAAGPLDLGAGRTAVAISAGSSHTCAILDNGNVLCWGYGHYGQLGYGSTADVGGGGLDPKVASIGPVNLGMGRTAVAISAGGSQTCAILDDRNVRCWGLGFAGQLGYGAQNNVGDGGLDPSVASVGTVELGGHTARAISTGIAHTCAILDDASVLCWGYGAYGRLGYGGTTNVGDTASTTPGMIGPVTLGAGQTAVAISAGAMHTCARLDDGGVRCWGYGANGRLGYCSESNVGDTPGSIPDTAGPVSLVAGDGGKLCPPPVPVNVSLPSISGQTTAARTLTEVHGSWSSAPTDYAYQWERCDSAGNNCGTITGAGAQTYTLGATDVGSTIRVLETASDGGASSTPATSAPTMVIKATPVPNPNAGRERGWRSCLGKASAAAKHLRALTHHGSNRQRVQARRRLSRQLGTDRQRCEKIWARIPGHITGLRAIRGGETSIVLDFGAPGTDGNNPPPARDFLVKESRKPIRTQRSFARAQTLCGGDCVIDVSNIGEPIALIVTNLRRHTTYYFVIVPRDHISLGCGPRSPTASATTGPLLTLPGLPTPPAPPLHSHRAPPCQPTPGSGRARRVYELTDSVRATLDDWAGSIACEIQAMSGLLAAYYVQPPNTAAPQENR